MIFGVDANEANVPNRVGSGTYTFEILKQWHKGSKHEFHLYLRDKPLSHMPAATDRWQYHVVAPRKMWRTFSLPLHLLTNKPKPDVFFAPAHYAPPLLRSKLIVTIHDLAYEYFPELFLSADLFKLKNWTKESVKKAEAVIAVSEATKKDLIKLYEVPEDKIHVIHNGYDKDAYHPGITVSADILAKYNMKPPYILFVGTIQPRKNVLVLVKAFEELKKSKSYPGSLVIAGNPGWLSTDIVTQIKSSSSAKDIVMTGYVEEDDLPFLYKGADVFVLPSLYEGFGIPLLESMAVGTPVVASNNSSLPEVVGDAGVLFDPKNPSDLAEALKTVLGKRGYFANKCLDRSKQFSWGDTARETLSLLEYIGKQK